MKSTLIEYDEALAAMRERLPAACGEELPVEFTPSTPDRFMNGRWEDAEQGSNAEASPSECPECACEVDVEWIEENEAE